MPARTILKERDSKPLIEQLRNLPSLSPLTSKSRVELESVKDCEVIFVDGAPLAFRSGGNVIPVLVNTVSLMGLPHIVVDMGAVPHVASGADVMAPGIRRVEGEFPASSLLVIVDEKYGKPLAVGRALVDSPTMGATRKGKVVKNLHYVGDQIWDLVKVFGRQTPTSG